MTDIRVVTFHSVCPDCHGRIVWQHGRPEKHQCWPEQDQQAASPWMVK